MIYRYTGEIKCGKKMIIVPPWTKIQWHRKTLKEKIMLILKEAAKKLMERKWFLCLLEPKYKWQAEDQYLKQKHNTRLKYASRKSWSFWFPSVPYRAASTFHRVMENMRWDYASWTLQKCIKKICDLVLKKVFRCIPVSTIPIFPR